MDGPTTKSASHSHLPSRRGQRRKLPSHPLVLRGPFCVPLAEHLHGYVEKKLEIQSKATPGDLKTVALQSLIDKGNISKLKDSKTGNFFFILGISSPC